jgi:plastocyanin
MEPQTTGTPMGTAKPRWTRLTIIGLLMASIGPLLMFLAGALFGLDLGEGLFFLVPGVIGLIAAYLVARFGTWAKIVGAIVGFLIAGLLFWTAFGLQAPASFFDFMPGVLVLPGGFIALIAGIGAAMAKRRGNLSDRPMGGERIWIRGVTYVVVLSAVVSGILTATGRSSADQSAAALSVIADDFEWDKLEYTVAGTSAVYVRNDDPFLHTFTVDELDIDVSLTPGDETLITIPAKPGTYVMYCTPHSDTESPEVPKSKDSGETEDMAARLIVT